MSVLGFIRGMSVLGFIATEAAGLNEKYRMHMWRHLMRDMECRNRAAHSCRTPYGSNPSPSWPLEISEAEPAIIIHDYHIFAMPSNHASMFPSHLQCV